MQSASRGLLEAVHRGHDEFVDAAPGFDVLVEEMASFMGDSSLLRGERLEQKLTGLWMQRIDQPELKDPGDGVCAVGGVVPEGTGMLEGLRGNRRVMTA